MYHNLVTGVLFSGEMINSLGTNAVQDRDNVSSKMLEFTLWYVGLGFFQILAGYIATAFLNISAERQASRVRKAYFRAMLRQEVGWYDSISSGELTTRLSGFAFVYKLPFSYFNINVERILGSKMQYTMGQKVHFLTSE